MATAISNFTLRSIRQSRPSTVAKAVRVFKSYTTCSRNEPNLDVRNKKISVSSVKFCVPHRLFSVTSEHFYFTTEPLLASARRQDVTRGDYAKLESSDIEYFKSVLHDTSQVITDEDQLEAYNRDWLHTCKGSSQLVLRPRTTEEVSKILHYCNERRLAVSTQGGNTGLVGGSVPVFDEIILSTRLMSNIISIDAVTGVLTCQAGCILEQLDSAVAEQDLIMPLDLGAKGTCHIGGNISTNAGGIRLLRYGSLHGSVLGVEAVLASGEVVNSLSSVRKDNVGYHLKHLFIGSEGTLGVVTGVSILCPRRSSSVNVCFLGCQSFEDVLHIMTSARGHFNEILSAYEIIDSESLTCVLKHLKLSNPLQSSCPFYVLVETSGSNRNHDEEKLNSFLESVSKSGLVSDGTLATEPSKIKNLWLIRESIAAALLDDGYCYKYDISLPLDSYYDIVNVMRERLKGLTVRVCGYGHVLDGNLHLNATSQTYDDRVVKLIQPFLYEYIAERRGSISAEHGLGFMKNNYMHYGRTDAAIKLMSQIKNMMDPRGILNPYKTLPVHI